METFWSEAKFWWRRQVRAWSLLLGVPLCAYISYFLFDSIHNTIVGIRLSHYLHRPAESFYMTTGFIALLWLICLLLTVFKAASVLWPAEVETGNAIPSSAYKADATVWPPAPKQPK